MDLEYLGGRGVRVCLQGHQPFSAAVRAVHDTLRSLREGVPPGELADKSSAELLKHLTGDAQYRQWLRDYMGID